MQLEHHTMRLGHLDLQSNAQAGSIGALQNLVASLANMHATMDGRIEKLFVIVLIAIVVGVCIGAAIYLKLPVK